MPEVGHSKASRAAIYALWLLLTPGTLVANPPDTEAADDADDDDLEWLEDGRDAILDRTDHIARWMDRFFGDVRAEEEAPHSTLRLRLEQDWDEDYGGDSDVRLRGNIHLPALHRRLSLLLGEESRDVEQDDLLIDDRDTPSDVALQYTARDRERDRFDFKLGLRSSLAIKASARYRYQQPFAKHYIGRVSEEVLYYGDDGFASRTRLELDRILDDDRVLRWRNRVSWDERKTGLRWDASFSLNERLGENRAISYYLSLSGITQPDAVTTGYGLGFRYRQTVFKPWLFAEIQPGYNWRKEERGGRREGAAAILLRLEAVLEREPQKGSRRDRSGGAETDAANVREEAVSSR